MALGSVGGTTVPHDHAIPQQGGGGAVKTSFGSAIGEFFSAIGSGIKKAFVAFGNAVASLFTRSADGGGATASASGFSSAEKRQMLAEFRESATYQAVQEGSSLNKANLEAGAKKILANPTAVQAMKDCGLSLTEAVSIFMYTTGDYSSINAQLRSGKVTDDVREVSAQCVSGMAKLPSHDDTVTRLVNLPDKIANLHVEGAVLQYDAYTSTSTKPGGDENFNGNMFMLLEPKGGSAGKDVSMFSNLPDEQEVLFPPGTQFKVIARTEPRDTSSMVMMIGDPSTRHAGKINVTLQEM